MSAHIQVPIAERVCLWIEATRWFVQAIRTGDWWEWPIGVWICERQGHRGVVWFNPGGSEPDYSCVRCGRRIG